MSASKPMHGTGKVLGNLFSVLLGLTIALVLAEVLLRSLQTTTASERQRLLFFSSPTFLRDQQGVVRYRTNADIRSVAVYDGAVEYDVGFSTNNLGFIDTRDYPLPVSGGLARVAMLGDSFTAGYHGGQPWVEHLQARLRASHQIYNLGVDGTGLAHFVRRAEVLFKRLQFDQIVILAISDDLQRSEWYPLPGPETIYFCSQGMQEQACLRRPPVAYVIPAELGGEEVVELAEQIHQLRNLRRPSSLSEWITGSHLYKLLRTAGRKMTADNGAERSRSLLSELKNRFPGLPIHFFHLPQKAEVSTGEYADPNLGPGIQALGIQYFPALQACDWEVSMFYPRDSHPNARGYRNISECVRRYLALD